VFKEVAVGLRGGCFYVDTAESSIPLSLAPWEFNVDYCELCAYPRGHGYHKERKEILRCDDETEHAVFYEATFAPGLYYGDFYKAEKIKLEEIYEHCRDLDSLLNHLNVIKPRVNLLSILVLCCKVTSNNEFFEILGKAIVKSVTLSLGTSLDRLNTIVTYVPRHKDEFKEDRFSGDRFNQAELLARIVARELGLNAPVETAYAKVPSGGKAQRRLSRCERYRAVAEIYELKDNAMSLVEGKTVILVDDVRTSGATAWRISALLHRAGAARVYVAVAGRSVLRKHANMFINQEVELCRPPWLL